MQLFEDEHDPQIAHDSLLFDRDRVAARFGVLNLIEQDPLGPGLGELRLFDHEQFCDVATLGEADLPRVGHWERSRVVKLATASTSRRYSGVTTSSGVPRAPSESPT